jgi:hypothetical protein
MIQQVIQQSFFEPFLTGGLLLGAQPTLGETALSCYLSTPVYRPECGFWLCTPTHITGMLLPKKSAPMLPGTICPRFFPPCNFKHDRTKG